MSNPCSEMGQETGPHLLQLQGETGSVSKQSDGQRVKTPNVDSQPLHASGAHSVFWRNKQSGTLLERGGSSVTRKTSASVEILRDGPGVGRLGDPAIGSGGPRHTAPFAYATAPSTPHPNNREKGGWLVKPTSLTLRRRDRAAHTENKVGQQS